MPENNSPNKIRQLVTLGLLSAILLVGQLALAPLPNIELVSTLLIIYTQAFKKQVFFIIYVFALLEGLLFGFGIWWVSYLYGLWSPARSACFSAPSAPSLIWYQAAPGLPSPTGARGSPMISCTVAGTSRSRCFFISH